MKALPKPALGASLRFRLLAGAAAIALLAIFAALMASDGASRTADRIQQATEAQQRMDLLSSLSGRIGDYAVVAAESYAAAAPEEITAARMSSRARLVDETLDRIDAAFAAAVTDAAADSEAERMRRATKSLTLARMKAQFAAFRREVESGPVEQRNIQAALNSFATRFSPQLNEAIADERRERDGAAHSIKALHEDMRRLTLIAGLAAAVLAAAYYALLIRPLIAQLDQVSTAADRIGSGAFDVALPAERRDEIGRLFEAVNRMAARLRRRSAEVDADRAGLNETIAARTAELSEANERLSRIDAERRRFFADVGHELRTPLTVILAESELGLKEGVEAPEAASALRVIRARAARLNRRIDDLLRVARSETGQIELEARPFDLSDAAADAIADMAPLAKRRGVTLAGRISSAPAVGDADWLRQVIGGLIENAVRHSPSGSVVEIAVDTRQGRANLSVTDEGEGLPPDESEAVFERFTRGSREARGSGFGVGLALARWVLERQSGTIALTSPAPRAPEGGVAGGPGAVVSLSLPAAPAGQVASQDAVHLAGERRYATEEAGDG